MNTRGVLKPQVAVPVLLVAVLVCVQLWRGRAPALAPAQAPARVAARPAAPAPVPVPRVVDPAPSFSLAAPGPVEFAAARELNRPVAERVEFLYHYDKPLSPAELKTLRQVLLSPDGPWADAAEEAWLKNEIMSVLGRLDTPDACYSALVDVYRDQKLSPDIRDYAIQHLSANADRFADSTALFNVLWGASLDVYTIPGTALMALERLGADGLLRESDRTRLKKRVIEIIGSTQSSDVLYTAADEGVRLFGLTPDMAVARDRFANGRDFTAKLTAMRWIVEYGEPKDAVWLAEAVKAQPLARMKNSYAIILKETGRLP